MILAAATVTVIVTVNTLIYSVQLHVNYLIDSVSHLSESRIRLANIFLFPWKGRLECMTVLLSMRMTSPLCHWNATQISSCNWVKRDKQSNRSYKRYKKKWDSQAKFYWTPRMSFLLWQYTNRRKKSRPNCEFDNGGRCQWHHCTKPHHDVHCIKYYCSIYCVPVAENDSLRSDIQRVIPTFKTHHGDKVLRRLSIKHQSRGKFKNMKIATYESNIQ